MELGQRLRQARLDAGLSQRQLCADLITRNMLSQIENGSARPSMTTLQQLAARLGRPMGYFLEEQAVTSPNQAAMDRARSAYRTGQYRDVLETLKVYRAPDAVFDPERWLLEALACLALAQQALTDGRNGYAMSLLEAAGAAGAQTPYYTRDTERQRLLLQYRAKPDTAAELAPQLPDSLDELLLRAHALLDSDPAQSLRILDAAVSGHEPDWHFLRGQACRLLGDYAAAVVHYRSVEQTQPQRVHPWLELCYRELGDYKMAYHYACLQRE